MLQIDQLMPGTDQALADEMEKGKEAIDALKGLSFDDAITKIANSIVDFSFKLLIAILVFYVGKLIIRKIYKTTRSVMLRRKVDPSLTTFVLSLIKMVLYFILIITIIGILGLETSSFLALFASAGVAIGMALSGTLQNFAGGVLILLLKPYKVGDYIETQGYTGTVKEIQIFHTVINTVDNKAIIIPNGGLSTGSINNYSLEDYRRVDWTIGLAYGTDYAAAKAAILEMVTADTRVVEKFVEDDREKRRLEMLGEDNPCDDGNPDCDGGALAEPEKLSWWQRFKMRSRRHKEQLEQKIKDQQALNAGIQKRIDRSPFVGLSELADSSINITVRAWTHSSNYWALFFEMNERFYTELPEKGFEFPFPQMDVHIQNPAQP